LNRPGIIAGPAHKIAVDPQSRVRALLRVELCRRDVVNREYASEREAVVSGGDDTSRVIRHDDVRVNEVEVSPVRDVDEKTVRTASLDLIPPDVRDLLLGCQTDDPSRNHSETFNATILVARGHENLQTQADPEEGPSGRHGPADRLDQTSLAEAVHGRPGGAIPRKDDGIRRAQIFGSLGQDRVRASNFKRAGDAAQVSRSVVDDDDSRA